MKRGRKIKYLLRGSLVVLLLLIAGASWIFWEARSFLKTPPQAQGEEIYFDVAPGSHMPQIACDLAEKGLITDARKFSWLARLKNQDSRVQAGRFALNTGWTPEQTLDALVNGAPVLFRVTIPEGLPWWQTAKALENAGLVRSEDFKKVIFDPEFLRHYGIPFDSAEGFLMPDTYLLRKPDVPMPDDSMADADAPNEAITSREAWQKQAREVAGRMVDNFWRKAAQVWPPQKGDGEISLKDIPKSRRVPGADPPEKISPPSREDLKKWVILASIVEKETGLENERARVAGVYNNRIKKNMLLQADPTVIYGLGESFTGRLRRVNLEDSGNLYNTYQLPGLPPGPICSFGIASLKAAINPEKHDYLYFVAVTDRGGHRFSRTFEEHGKAVQEYRRNRSGR